MEEEVFLSEEQKAKVLNEWNSRPNDPPSLLELIKAAGFEDGYKSDYFDVSKPLLPTVTANGIKLILQGMPFSHLANR